MKHKSNDAPQMSPKYINHKLKLIKTYFTDSLTLKYSAEKLIFHNVPKRFLIL